jgi:hypothetical protein
MLVTGVAMARRRIGTTPGGKDVRKPRAMVISAVQPSV